MQTLTLNKVQKQRYMPSVVFRSWSLFLAGSSKVEGIGVRGGHVSGQLV